MSTQKQHDTEKLHDAVQRQVIEGLEQGRNSIKLLGSKPKNRYSVERN